MFLPLSHCIDVCTVQQNIMYWCNIPTVYTNQSAFSRRDFQALERNEFKNYERVRSNKKQREGMRQKMIPFLLTPRLSSPFFRSSPTPLNSFDLLGWKMEKTRLLVLGRSRHGRPSIEFGLISAMQRSLNIHEKGFAIPKRL